MKQKNILLIFTDQQRYDTIHALGNEKIYTPNLDKLTERSIAFTRAYTNSPVCVAARYTMHTGLLPHRTGCFDNGQMPYNVSFMEVLKKHGYQTHGTGKMHFTFDSPVGDNSLWGFDERDVSEECGNIDDYKHFIDANGFSHVSEPLGFRSEMYYIPQVSQLNAETHNSSWASARSIDFLKTRDKSKPFFLMSSFVKPHPPFETPAPWNKLYRTVDMEPAKCPGGNGNDEVITYWNKFQNRYKYRDKGTDFNLYRTMKAAYYSAISFIDYNIGKILSYMRDENLLDNTLILFTADHGELLGDYNCYGKRSYLDSAARIPMIMYDPDLNGGRRCDTPVSLVDVFPTLMDAANINYGGINDGTSLIQIAGGIKNDRVIGQFSSGATALYMYMTEKYKYIYSAADNKEFLFDLVNDSAEIVNFADHPKYRSTAELLKINLINEYKTTAVHEALEGIDTEKNKFKTYEKKVLPPEPDALLLRQDTQASIPDIKNFIIF